MRMHTVLILLRSCVIYVSIALKGFILVKIFRFRQQHYCYDAGIPWRVNKSFLSNIRKDISNTGDNFEDFFILPLTRIKLREGAGVHAGQSFLLMVLFFST